MTAWLSDVRTAARGLRRHPGFVTMTVGVLAVGLGAAVAIFVAVDAVLVRSLPLPSEQLGLTVRVLATNPAELAEWRGTAAQVWESTSYPVFADYRDQSTSFSLLAGYSDGNAVNVAIGDGGRPERVDAGIVSGTYFEVFGAAPALGRLLSRQDDMTPGAHPIVVLSHAYWRDRFGADPSVAGTSIRINGHPFTVVGVARRDFVGPSFASTARLWVPMAMAAQAMPSFSERMDVLAERRFSWLETIGRLKPGVRLAAAQAELEAIAKHRAETQKPGERDPSAKLVPAADTGFGVDPESRDRVVRPAWVLSALVSLVLAISCANAAGLLLARGERRRAEIALRLCLGASRRRVVRQLVAEGVILAAAAAAAGVLVAGLLLRFLSTFAEGFPLPLGALTPLDHPRVVGFAVVLAVVCGVVFSLAPALHLVAPVAARLALALRGADAAGVSGGRAASRALVGRGVLIVGQVALSTALLAGSLLLLRTLEKAARIDLGFEPSGAAVATVDLALQGYDAGRGANAWRELLDRVRSAPGVAAAALGKSVPLQATGMRVTLEPEGYVFAPGEDEAVQYNVISPDYFGVLRWPLLAGREFAATDREGTPAVAIVNRAFAERFWGVSAQASAPLDPLRVLGKRVGDVPPGRDVEIVGVVENAKLRSVRESPQPAFYVPLGQAYLASLTIVARAVPGFDASGLPAVLEQTVGGFDADLPVFRARTLEAHLGVTLAQERAMAAFFASFAVLALGLVASGLYSLVSFATALRWREIGIRMALGAQERQVLGLALRQAALLAAAGAALGVGVALALGRGLASLLYGVAATDAPTLLAAALVLLAVALAAGFGPARRAARMNPASALRRE